jgi:uncharacterized integral membrane protein
MTNNSGLKNPELSQQDWSHFSISAVLSKAWSFTKGAKWPIWAVSILLALVAIIFSIIYLAITDNTTETGTLAFYFLNQIFFPFIIFIITAPFYAGLLMIAIKHTRGEKINAGTGLHYFHKIIPLAITFLIMTFIASFISLIVRIPAIATSISVTSKSFLEFISSIFYLLVFSFFILSIPLVADKNFSPGQALKTSFALTKSHWIKIFISIFIGNFIFFLTSIPLLLGVLTMSNTLIVLGIVIFIIATSWLWPFIILIQGVIYRYLVKT